MYTDGTIKKNAQGLSSWSIAINIFVFPCRDGDFSKLNSFRKRATTDQSSCNNALGTFTTLVP